MSRRFFAMALIVATLFSAIVILSGCAGNQAFTQGSAAARSGNWDAAVVHFAEASRLEPGNKDYMIEFKRARFEASKEHVRRGSERLAARDCVGAADAFRTALTYDSSFAAASQGLSSALSCIEAEREYSSGVAALALGREDQARKAFQKVAELYPSHPEAAARLAELSNRPDRPLVGPYEIRLSSPNPITLRLADAGIREAFGVLSKLSGVNILFDEDIKKEKRVTLSLEGVRFTQALDMLCTLAGVSRKAISENTILIYPNTPAKSSQYVDHYVRTFVLANTDATKMVTLIRGIVPVKKLYANEAMNAVVARDDPDVLAVVQKVIEANDIADAEMMLDVEIIEVDRGRLLNLGIELSPKSASARISNGTTSGDSGTEIPWSVLQNLTAENILVTLPTAVLNLKSQNSGTEILANPKLRVKNRGKAKIHIGEKVPIITATTNQGVTTENVQYQDVGVKLDVEPWVHLGSEVTLKVRLEVSALGSQVTGAQTVAYRINSRATETELRLHDRETQIIGGLINDEERKTMTRIPGLGDIPVLGRLFSSESREQIKTDILMSITPYILRPAAVPPRELADIFSGREAYASATRPIYDVPVQGGESVPPSGEAAPAKPEGSQETAAEGAPEGIAVIMVNGPPEVNQGQEFEVAVSIAGGKNIHDTNMTLMYDPRKMNPLAVSEGELLKGGGKKTTFSGNINAGGNRITVYTGRVDPGDGADGDGVLFRVKFHAIAAGNTMFAVRNEMLRDNAQNVVPSRNMPLRIIVR